MYTALVVNDAAKDYIDLHQHVESSTNLLASLETFLATFQNDLSAVSGHISELQQRSRLIDARLEGRKTLQTQLGPVLASMIIPPELIDIIIDTDPSERWLEAIEMLEQKLTAIRSGPRIAARQDLDMAAEKLRIRVSRTLCYLHKKPCRPLMYETTGRGKSAQVSDRHSYTLSNLSLRQSPNNASYDLDKISFVLRLSPETRCETGA